MNNSNNLTNGDTPMKINRLLTCSFCLRCGEPLDLETSSRCAHCRLQFNADDPETYSTVRVQYDSFKCYLPGFCLSVLVGFCSYAIVMTYGEMGPALFIAVPMAMGTMLGYKVPATGLWLFVIAFAALLSTVFGIITFNFAGLFCGAALVAVFFGPLMIGVTLGAFLRLWLKRTRFAQRSYLPMVLIALSPFGVQAVDDLFPNPVDIATVETQYILPTSAAEAWNNLMFYEEVEHEPPWLLKLALPRPVRAEGSMGHVGDTRRCIYENGHLTKEFTERIENRRLAFKVIEQHLHFERDVTLIDGSFELEPLGENRTRLTLTTRYIRHLRPAWIWKSMESKIVHTLHRHVLQGVGRKTNASEIQLPPNPDPYEYKLPSPSNPSEHWLAATSKVSRVAGYKRAKD